MIDWSAASSLDRVEAQRVDPGWVRSLWNDQARLLGVGELSLTALADGTLQPSTPVGEFDSTRHFLLGLQHGQAWFAEWAPRTATMPLRSVIEQLPPADLELAVCAVSLTRWHATSGYCSSCGALTQPVAAGLSRVCTDCGLELYPRTDPAVIVAIQDQDERLLLGRQPSWMPGRRSVFAGFVEIGESLEQAVHREMAEEVGLELSAVGYLGSQPWPFPRSLMVGFQARTRQVEITAAPGEIELAEWYAREELEAAVDGGQVILPPHASIARRMIDAWLAKELPDLAE